MNVLETEWWSCALPVEWWAEAEEETIVIGDQDDVGCIEISSLLKEQGEFDTGEVAALARGESPDISAWESLVLGDFSGVTGRLIEDDAAIREWYVAAENVLLFITYSCDEENNRMDDAAVDEILDTLLLKVATSD
ncbi:MAG: hypothetical protein ABJ056_18155 [Halioglobus sp.]